METYLFDLDGTLTDPGTGITSSILYALGKYGIKADRSSLYRFIGPPLRETFIEKFSFSREQAEEAVGYYREYFEEAGMFENEVYHGVPELLEKLNKKDKRIILATSKPEPYARKILAYFNLDSYFYYIGGSDMNGSMSSKPELVAHILKRSGCNSNTAVMTGDRKYDIEGAKANRITSVGAAYGYGGEGELLEAKADFIVHSVSELTILLAG